MPRVVLPAAFASANLILYFGGFDTMWKIDAALVVGLLLFAFGAIRTGSYDFQRMVKPALWAPAWLAGMLIISLLGRYGDSQLNLLPEWVDLLVVIAFSSPSTTGRYASRCPRRRSGAGWPGTPAATTCRGPAGQVPSPGPGGA